MNTKLLSIKFKESKSMQRKRAVSDDIFIQKQSFILDSIKQNRNRVLFFLAFVLYVLLTVLGTTDRDFFFESGISFPLLNIKLPLIAFYVVVPVIIIFVHFNILYLYKEHQKLLKKHAKIKNFYSSMPLGMFDMPIITTGTIHTIIKIFIYLVVYIMPLLTLYVLWWHFNKYQSSFYSGLHLFFIAMDTILLWYFLFSSKIGKVFSLIAFFVFILATLLQLAIKNEDKVLWVLNKYFPNINNITSIEFIDLKQYYPRLELSGEQLVSFDYSQLKSLQSLDKTKSLALLQPPLNLENRSFKYANFAHTLLVHVNLRNAQLRGANFFDAKLQGADLSGANLQGSNLSYSKFQGADLSYAKLQGADLSNAEFQGANLLVANLQGSNLLAANLRGSNLSYSKFQGVDLSYANLQGANLLDTELQWANLSHTELQGTFSCINTESYSFTERINQQIGKNTDLNCLNQRSLKNEKGYKIYIIYNLQYIKTCLIDFKGHMAKAIQFIKKSTSAIPDLSKAQMGSYTKEEARKWIEEYKQAMGEK